jgi:hypothetical protein
MTMVLASTTISVRRVPDQSGSDPWDRDVPDPQPQTIATEVPADISINMGRSAGPGDTQTLEFMLVCDPTDLTFRQHDRS